MSAKKKKRYFYSTGYHDGIMDRATDKRRMSSEARDTYTAGYIDGMSKAYENRFGHIAGSRRRLVQLELFNA